jgi:hypothetical protein
MRSHWKSVVMVAALALFLGIAAPAWSQAPVNLDADPSAEEYSAHVIPFYKIDDNWFSYLVVSDTSYGALAPSGTTFHLTFYNAACNLVSDADIRLTAHDSQYFPLHDPEAANGQFNGIPSEGVVLLTPQLGTPAVSPVITYILLINANNNSLIRIDSIPCRGPNGVSGTLCTRNAVGGGTGTWLRYSPYNTVAATFGHEGNFQTWLYFFSAAGDLEEELGRYGLPLGTKAYADGLHVDAWCNEQYLGSRRLKLECTQRLPLDVFNYTRLHEFPNDNCQGAPGHIVTFASDNGTDPVFEAYSGFQETIAELVPGINLVGTGYMHHRTPVVPVVQ